MLQDEDIYMNRAYFRILRNLFMQTDEVDQRTQSRKEEKRPAGKRRGNLRASIHAESGRTQLCMRVFV